MMSSDPLAQAGPEAVTYPPGVAYIDGRFCPMSEAKISVLDWGFLRSDATYDVVHVWERRFFRLDLHVDRFLRGVERLRLSLPFERAALVDILKECVRRSGLSSAYVEMVCTRGFSPRFSRDPRDADNRFIAFAIPFSWVADEAQRERGLRLAISKIARIPPESLDPTIKNYHWLDIVQGLYEAYDRGAENALLVDFAGNVTEGAGFNVFAVKDGGVVTPGRGVLEGITRRTALDLCAELGIAAAQRSLPADELRAADEVFISSTAGGIMPVTKIDDAPVGDGRPGPTTARLAQLYWAKHRDPDWTTPVD
ncbi:MAG: aminotransferase class IV [Kiloniellales bacterium]|nr:aminotransferase class IV [Kiloniellales bacterium]